MARRGARFMRSRPSSRRGGARRSRRVTNRRSGKSSVGRRVAGAFGQLIYNFARRMIAAPMQLATGATSAVSPWTVGLTTVPTLLLKAITTAYSANLKNDWKDVRTGSAGCWGITLDDLIWTSPLAHEFNASASPQTIPNRVCPFSQGRVLSLRVLVTPVVDIDVRGGCFSAAVVGISDINELRSLNGDKDGVLNYEAIANLPGAVVSPASRPFVINWRPMPNSFSSQWHEIGHSANGDTLMGDRGSLPFARLHLHYRDMAVNAIDKVNTQYSLDRSMFDITFESRVSLRSMDTEGSLYSSEQHVLRNNPIEFFNRSTITMYSSRGRHELTDRHYTIKDGCRFLNVEEVFTSQAQPDPADWAMVSPG